MRFVGCGCVRRPTDRYPTELRAGFLLVEDGFDMTNYAEIQHRLATGKTTAGGNAVFRVVIDIYFQTNPLYILQNVDNTQIQFPVN